ncbi:MAG TPA: head GIN domain-containing protein [Bacteroidales bacterium]|nr:head GIN domain-containing protein [Bacteroidales bacterium]
MIQNRLTLVAIAMLTLTLTSCYDNYYYIEGNGRIVTETLDLDTFDGIVMQGVEDVDISYGDEQKVVVTGDENIIQMISHDVKDNTWYMHLQRGNYRNYDLKYYITLPRINYIDNQGVSRVVINEFINEGDLDIYLKGAGTVELNRMENTEKLYVNIEGLGQVKAFGEFPSIDQLDVIITGAGRFLGYPVQALDCYVDIVGTGKCEVSAVESLSVFIEGAGKVNYKGYPDIMQRINGLGCVNSRN